MKHKQIYSTNDLSQFLISEKNRGLVLNRGYNRIVASMKKYGFLEAYPLLCKKEKAGLVVYDGQHRLHAAKQLKLPVYYVVLDESTVINIPDLQGGRLWGTSDYAQSCANQNDQHCIELLDFAKKHNITVNQAIALLWGSHVRGNNGHEAIRKGRFLIKDMASAERIMAILKVIRELCPEMANNRCLVALQRIARVAEMDEKRMIRQMKSHSGMLKNEPTAEAFVQQFERIYNYHTPKKIPIAHLAEEALRQFRGKPKNQ